MGLWNVYFILKALLDWFGYLHVDVPRNFLFLLFLALAVRTPGKWRKPVNAISVLLAVLLLWRDSWLPPLRESLAFVADPAQRPTGAYMVEFLLRCLNPVPLLIVAAVAAAGVWAVRRMKANLVPISILVLLVSAAIHYSADKGQGEGLMSDFYRTESAKVVRFPASQPPDFDLVVLQVCSLSWDDLKTVGLSQDPFWNRFDYLLTDFNSVTSYSNPAAYRLLRAPCGQTSHEELYHAVPEDCYLMEGLRRAGFKTATVFNHEGSYGDMREGVVTLGKADPVAGVAGMAVKAYNFDDRPIYGDYDSLERWWKARLASDAPAAAVYYNTISLHEGVRLAGESWSDKGGRVEEYRGRAGALFSEVGRFMDELKASGRNIVIVFVPEHGAALTGTRLQVRGLRDIPLPAITEVPVGVKLIGPAFQSQGEPRRLEKETSYFALATMLSDFVARSPFRFPAEIPAAMAALPVTPFLSENQNARIAVKDGEDYLSRNGGSWMRLPKSVLNPDN